MIRLKKIVAIMMSISVCTTFTVGCSKKEDNKQEVKADKLKIEKVEKPSTGIVSDGKGWQLWDKEGHTTTDKRGAVGENAVVASGKYEASQAGLEIIEEKIRDCTLYLRKLRVNTSVDTVKGEYRMIYNIIFNISDEQGNNI